MDNFTKVDSEHIDGVSYSSLARKLAVKFKNGSVYHVHDVSHADHQEFMSAPSQGEHYHQVFRDHYNIEKVK